MYPTNTDSKTICVDDGDVDDDDGGDGAPHSSYLFLFLLPPLHNMNNILNR